MGGEVDTFLLIMSSQMLSCFLVDTDIILNYVYICIWTGLYCHGLDTVSLLRASNDPQHIYAQGKSLEEA